MYIPPRIEGCVPGSEAVVLHFFQESQLSQFFGNTLLPDPMRIMDPSLKVFEANFSHEMEQDKRARFNLAHLANLTKQDKRAFASLAHTTVDD